MDLFDGGQGVELDTNDAKNVTRVPITYLSDDGFKEDKGPGPYLVSNRKAIYFYIING